MRALLSDNNGSAVLSEVPEPTVISGQVLIAVEAVSVNRGETFQLEKNPPPGWRPGKDFAGRVVQAEASGFGPEVGTRVVGHAAHSSWAERIAVDLDRLVVLPDSIASDVAAALPLAGLTALRLARLAHLGPGTSVLMTGASGGVGHYFAELSAMAGAKLTAVVASHQRGTQLRAFGARTVTDVQDAHRGFDVGMDSVGGDALAAVRHRTSPDGSVIWFGQASRAPAELDFFDWIDGTVAAPITQFHYESSDRSLQRDLATLVDLTANSKLHPLLDTPRSFDHAAQAIADLRERRVRGNLILKW